jgi:hypothetical protein
MSKKYYSGYRITGFLNFVHRPEFKMLENTMFRQLDLFPSSDDLRETPTLLGPNLNDWNEVSSF